jgi:AraC-like DNA-binding protein
MGSETFFRKHRVNRYDGPDLYRIIHPHFLNFHRMTVSRDYEYPRHDHSSYELIWVEKGPYSCRLNGVEIEIGSGGILIVKPGDSHQDHLKKGQSHYVLHFSLDQPLFAPSAEPAMQIGEIRDEWVSPIFKDIEAESSPRGQSDRFAGSLQDSLLETLFWRIVRRLPESALSESFSNDSNRQEFSTELYRIFHLNLNRPLSVKSMAERMGMSNRSLALKCSKYFGNSPGKLFLLYRMRNAEILLKHPDKSIKEISYELGFDTPFNFSRAFKRVTGVSPTEFRKPLSS